MKKLKVSLLAKVVIAIAAGVVFGQFLPGGIARIFVTFNSLFGNFLSFSIPLIILGLVTPAIGELGKGAGRLLALTALIAYGSTIFSGFFTYFSSSAIFPHILPVNTELTAMENPEDFMLQPYFIVAMPPLMDVMTALLLSFTIGLGLSYINGETLRESFSDFQKIITKLIEAVIIPLLPLHIFGIFLNMTVSGASHGRDYHVLESDNRDICPACVAITYPVYDCRQHEWKKSVAATEKYASGLRDRTGDTILSRHHPCNIGSGGQERGAGEHRNLRHSPLCYYPSGR